MDNVHDKFIYSDSPLFEVKDKQFESFSKKFSEAIIKFFSITGKNDNSFVIGLNGEWGCGKTTMLNLVTNKIEQEGDITVINFNPWNFSSSEDLIRKFFLEVFLILNKDTKNKVLTNCLEQYIRAIGFIDKIVDSKVTSIASNVGEFIKELVKKNDINEHSLDEIKKELNEKLNDKKLLVIIDDIDRLLPNQLLQIFQLVKSVGDLKNIIYILSFDKEVVNENLKIVSIYNPEKYLEKIIQISFDVPKVSINNIKNFFYKALSDFGITISKRIGEHQYQYLPCSLEILNFKNSFKNFRKLKRYLNTFSFEYKLVQDIVDPDDFVAIIYLKVFHFNLYNKIFDKKETLTSFRGLNEPSKELSMLIEGEDDSKEELLKELLKYLFPTLSKYYDKDKSEKQYKSNSICNEEYFDYYFSLVSFNKCCCEHIFSAHTYEQLKIELDKIIIQDNKDIFTIIKNNVDDVNEEELKRFLKLIFDNWNDFENRYRINRFNSENLIDFLEKVCKNKEEVNILLLNIFKDIIDTKLMENLKLIYIINDIFSSSRKKENKIFKLFLEIYKKINSEVCNNADFITDVDFNYVTNFVFYNFNENEMIEFSKAVFKQILRLVDEKNIKEESIKNILENIDKKIKDNPVVEQEEDLIKIKKEISIKLNKDSNG